MRKPVLVALAVVMLTASCRGKAEPTVQLPNVHRSDVAKVVLKLSDLDQGWTEDKSPSPNTVQIGGRVGAANVRPARAEATSAFHRKEGDGFVSDSVYLVRTEEMARAVIAAHQDAARSGAWTQDRDDGGHTAFSYAGSITGLSALGDEVFGARLKAVVTDAAGKQTESSIEYVTYSVGPLVAFVVAENQPVAQLASRQEAKVARLLTR